MRPDIFPSNILYLIHKKQASVWTKKPKRDFIYVEDVGRSNVCALKADVSDEFYNVGTGVQTSIKK